MIPQHLRFLCLAVSLLAPTTSIHAVDIQPVPSQAVRRIAAPRIMVYPDRPDWTYKVGEPVKFTVRVTADYADIPNAPVKLTWGPEQLETQSKEVLVPVGGLQLDAGTLQQPGFLRLTVKTEINGRSYSAAATAAFSPEEIKPTQTNPDDFDEFWNSVKVELAAQPLESTVTLLPDACTPDVNVYHVALRIPGSNWQGNAKFYGILCEPKKPGSYPAILRVPGAGVRPYGGDIGNAAKGVITLEVGIHGIPVNMQKYIYDELHAGALNGYQTFNLDNRDLFYYRRVIQGCLRAADFLASRPNWNGEKLAVAGASQGGMLSIIVGALHPKVTGISAIHPAFSDVTGYLQGRAGGWPHMFRNAKNATPEKLRTTQYYDVVNFARRLKVPGHYMWGYNDDVCPPTSIFAAYNVITAPKELSLTLEMAHTYNAEQTTASDDWLLRHLGVTK